MRRFARYCLPSIALAATTLLAKSFGQLLRNPSPALRSLDDSVIPINNSALLQIGLVDQAAFLLSMRGCNMPNIPHRLGILRTTSLLPPRVRTFLRPVGPVPSRH